MKLRKKIKKDWIIALTSGDYEQGVGVLHNVKDNTFCCLGVLADLAVLAGVGRWGDDGDYVGPSGDREGMELPSAVIQWAFKDGDDSCSGHFADPKVKVAGDVAGEPTHLSVLNDHGKSFTFIAKRIKESL